MNIRALIRNVAAKVCTALVCLLSFSSCDSWIYEEEGDCSVYYRLKFRYDMNLKWADAFANEVSSVHLYAFDRSGVLAWQKAEQIVPGTAEDYSMLLDLPPVTTSCWHGAGCRTTASVTNHSPYPKPVWARPVWSSCSVR